jgi:hypothetical protein
MVMQTDSMFDFIVILLRNASFHQWFSIVAFPNYIHTRPLDTQTIRHEGWVAHEPYWLVVGSPTENIQVLEFLLLTQFLLPVPALFHHRQQQQKEKRRLRRNCPCSFSVEIDWP